MSDRLAGAYAWARFLALAIVALLAIQGIAEAQPRRVAPTHKATARKTKARKSNANRRQVARKTGIIATLGPQTANVSKLQRMLRAGMKVARINMSHNGARSTKAMMAMFREAAALEGKNTPVLFDLPGGKVRLTKLAGPRFSIKAGQTFVLTTDPRAATTPKMAGVGYPKLAKHARVGHRVLLDDGKLELVVTAVGRKHITTRVIRGGQIRSRMGLALKDVELPFPAMTAQDRRKLKIAVDNGADWIGASFVQGPANVLAVRRALDKMGAKHVKIVAKIESKRGVKNLGAIMDHADMIMIARGDLKVAVGEKNLARVQAKIAKQARARGVEFIVATGLVSNMLSQPSPSAANRRDIRRTAGQGARWLMLNETAISPFAVEAVEAVNAELRTRR